MTWLENSLTLPDSSIEPLCGLGICMTCQCSTFSICLRVLMSNFFLISKYSIKISIGNPRTIIGRAMITARGKIIKVGSKIKCESVSG